MRRLRYAYPIIPCCIFLLAPAEAAPLEEKEKEEPKEAPEGEDPAEAEPKGRGANTEGWDKYLDLLESKYIPAEKEGASPSVQIKFDLAPEVPKGTKIQLEFELSGLPFDSMDFILKDENRKGLTATWKSKKRVAVGEYFLLTRIHLEEQTPAVQKIIKGNTKRFPSKNAPWQMYYFHQPIQVGTPEDAEKEMEALCEALTAIVDKFLVNGNEFKEKMDKVKKGEELVSGEALDVPKFTAYIVEWRKKQGAVQQEIVEFQVNEPGLFQKSPGALMKLQELGRMVSKRSYQLQKEITDKYKLEAINPPSHDFFDRGYKYPVNAKTLNDRVTQIERLACPKKAAEAEAAAAKEAEKAAEKASKPEASTDAEGTGEKEGAGAKPEEGEDPPPAEEPEKPKKKKKTVKPTKK